MKHNRIWKFIKKRIEVVDFQRMQNTFIYFEIVRWFQVKAIRNNHRKLQISSNNFLHRRNHSMQTYEINVKTRCVSAHYIIGSWNIKRWIQPMRDAHCKCQFTLKPHVFEIWASTRLKKPFLGFLWCCECKIRI